MTAKQSFELVSLPAGRVTLSDRRTQRIWPVDLQPFRLAAVPVTQALYAEVTGVHPSTTEGGDLPVDNVSWRDAVQFCNTLSERDGLTPAYRLAGDDGTARRDDHGTVQRDGEGDGEGGVSWDAAADGYRLPTEAEWEYACRAGTSGPRYGALDDVAWHRGNSGERMHEVGGKQPNAWGLHDMLGNAWDWCWDIYDAEGYGAYRVLRGGGWFDEHWSCRASVRRRSHPSLRLDDVSFRVARGS
ncbi:formylglycine-generating enzyme family protein [Paractinoplanes durhamensis]|uniref:Sulfatase-modifying factor enzyme-like domain-containing protein n=1 Tax=Paractinoplanes durhamensis TaxID=113563 RepID=A0ABQ3ZB89_9ACTN|nr:SUMF1/EgtB/PvdO family nonheme iron enzyme [Actinoplanes durhamensis]GIE07090.1 hypothetical protein Adu01nite_84400 [Actinoplanes durhamensis]